MIGQLRPFYLRNMALIVGNYVPSGRWRKLVASGSV